jgi:hypothetical protein
MHFCLSALHPYMLHKGFVRQIKLSGNLAAASGRGASLTRLGRAYALREQAVRALPCQLPHHEQYAPRWCYRLDWVPLVSLHRLQHQRPVNSTLRS